MSKVYLKCKVIIIVKLESNHRNAVNVNRLFLWKIEFIQVYILSKHTYWGEKIYLRNVTSLW